jgi:hypothetical protein
MIKYEDVVLASSSFSDIQHQLIRLYDITTKLPIKDKTIVELGMRYGKSTTALLAAVLEDIYIV